MFSPLVDMNTVDKGVDMFVEALGRKSLLVFFCLFGFLRPVLLHTGVIIRPQSTPQGFKVKDDCGCVHHHAGSHAFIQCRSAERTSCHRKQLHDTVGALQQRIGKRIYLEKGIEV